MTAATDTDAHSFITALESAEDAADFIKSPNAPIPTLIDLDPLGLFDRYGETDESGPSSIQFGDFRDPSDVGTSQFSLKDGHDITDSGMSEWLGQLDEASDGQYPEATTEAKGHEDEANMPNKLLRVPQFPPLADSSPLSSPVLNFTELPHPPTVSITSSINPANAGGSKGELQQATTNNPSSGVPIRRSRRRRAPLTTPIHKLYKRAVPRSSIPSNTSAKDYADECRDAALAARLSPYQLDPCEHEILMDHITPAQVTTYLNIRNGIIRLWKVNQLVPVILEEALGCAKDIRYFGLAHLAYQWLVRRGSINYGVVYRPSTAGQLTTTGVSEPKQKTIIVVGAGVAGLGCARQLQGLFDELGKEFTSLGERPPKIIVLEGRGRIGGRIYSKPLLNQHRKMAKLPQAGMQSRVEMGAQVITGYNRGNPLDTLVRAQLGLHTFALKDDSVLYDTDGSKVDAMADTRLEHLFNDILDRVAVYKLKQNRPMTAKGDEKLIDSFKEPVEGDTVTDGAASLAEVNQHDIAAPLPTTAQLKAEEPELAEKQKLTGKVNMPLEPKPKPPAAKVAKSLGFKLKPGVTVTDSIDLSSALINRMESGSYGSPTLGYIMEEAIKQYQGLIELTPLDLRLLFWHWANMEYADAVDLHKLSLFSWDQDNGNEFEGHHSEVIGGYSQVPLGLRAGHPLGKALYVLSKQVVTEIEYCPNRDEGYHDDDDAFNIPKARVRTTEGEFEADRVILTVPLGVLKANTIKFSPPLPKKKAAVINRLGFGLLSKVILVYETAFWGDRCMFGMLNNSELNADSLSPSLYVNRGEFYLFWSRTETAGLPTLTALMAGGSAHSVQDSQKRKVELRLEMTRRLRKIFGEKNVPQPIECHVTDWQNDEFARGSYSYLAAEALPEDYDEMAHPIGNLHFAGEATCRTHPATVHGAYISGLRAAREVIDELLGPVQLQEPLVLPKIKITLNQGKEANPLKRPTPPMGPELDEREKRQCREAYEAGIIGAIHTALGQRPDKPDAKRGSNAYLLFQEEMWSNTKGAMVEDAVKRTGNMDAKVNNWDVRERLGRVWKELPDSAKERFVKKAEENKANWTKVSQQYQEKTALWDLEARRVRQEYVAANPPERLGITFVGPTAIERHSSHFRKSRYDHGNV